MENSNFYSKVLLFGEYGIIKNARGLSIPYNSYKGCLKKQNPVLEEEIFSNKKLSYFLQYLKDIACKNDRLKAIDLEKLQKDIDEGLYFDSSIPQGYGLGSSGALVAAIYDRYADQAILQSTVDNAEIIYLKEIFIAMESFFHGISSGVDPLNSYLSSPLLIHSHLNVEPISLPIINEDSMGAIFLLDSGQQGQTEPMVKIFMQNMKDEKFSTMLKTEFIQSSEDCIDAFIARNKNDLFTHIKTLSKTVFNRFKPMIPDSLHSIWDHGIDSDDYYLKLCGSGGGGYALGFTRNIEKTRRILKGHDIATVCTL